MNLANIKQTERILDDLERERKKIQRMGAQGAIIIARELITDDAFENFYNSMEMEDQRLQNIMFLEEVFRIHLDNMKGKRK
jgi:hypothetical protein